VPSEATDRQRRDTGISLWAALLRVHAGVVPRIEAELLAARGLPLSWYDVLLELEHAPGRRLRMQELGERAVLSRTRVSRIVDELVTAGFVVREPDPADRRGFHAAITPAGRSRFRRAAPAYVDAITRHVTDHLTTRELETVWRALERVLSANS
jgi:DNA-binding MarR family transcriptional regulator